MIQPGEIISYLDMCGEEKVNLQRGMNFRLGGNYSVILMSLRPNAPYADRVENDGKVLIYEGHDILKTKGIEDPKAIDQPMSFSSGTLTQNGKFFEAAKSFSSGSLSPEIVKVYEKLRAGIWVYNGTFILEDAWQESDGSRNVFKFRLTLAENFDQETNYEMDSLEHNRVIPSSVKLAVWQRDKGQCVRCGSNDNLHFDHIIPYSKGGSSLVAENIQLLCARHNLAKRDKIQ